MPHRALRRFSIPVLLILPLACNESASPPTESTAATGAAAASAPAPAPGAGWSQKGPRGLKSPGKRRMGRRAAGGMAGMLLAGARDLKLTPEQTKKLDELAASSRKADDAGGETRDEMKKMHAELVAGIKAGKIDAAKLEQHAAVLQKAGEARREREIATLNGLHAALDASQRKDLVEKLRARQRPTRAGRADRPARPELAKRQVDRWTRELGLSEEQQKKATALMEKRPAGEKKRDPEAANERREALLAAFEKDTFDAKTLDLGPAGGKPRAAEMAKQMNELLAILEPGQREKLAASFERGSRRGRGGPPGRGMPGRRGFRGPGGTGGPGGFGLPGFPGWDVPGWDEGADEDAAEAPGGETEGAEE